MTDELAIKNGKGLALYGERESVKEIAERLLRMMPGTTRFTANEALTIAQIAVAHGLDPFNGEVWGIKSEDGKWYGTMVGIKGLRKAAKRQAESEGGVYWTEPPTRVEPKKYDAPENAVVYEIHLRDTVTMQAYGKSLNILTSAGVPYAEAVRMVGNAPVWKGVGIAKADERSKLPIHARAKKRAEADALRQRYDVQFIGVEYTEASEEMPADADVPVVEGDYSPVPEVDPQPELTPEERKEREAVIMGQLGFEV